jgi:hypothetical protein
MQTKLLKYFVTLLVFISLEYLTLTPTNLQNVFSNITFGKEIYFNVVLIPILKYVMACKLTSLL